jgi:hypothetical protein
MRGGGVRRTLGIFLWDVACLWYLTYRTIQLVDEGHLFWASVMAVGALIALLNLHDDGKRHRRSGP